MNKIFSKIYIKFYSKVTVRVIGPVIYIYISMYILGQGPNSRTLSSPRTDKHCHESPC